MFAGPDATSRHIRLLALAFVGLCLIGCNPAKNENHAPLVQGLAWKMDMSGQATLADMASSKDWQPFDGVKNWGFGTEPIWVRYRLRAAEPGDSEAWIVRIRPAFQEHLTFYDPRDQLQLTSGNRVLNRDDALNSLTATFQIKPLPVERDVYLRLQTQRTRLILTDVMYVRAAAALSRSEEWLLGFLISISMAFSLWGLIQWVVSRDHVMGAFAVKQWIATFWALNIFGFTRILLGDGINLDLWNAADGFIRIWTVAATMWFLLTLNKDYQPSLTWVRTTQACIAMLLCLPLLQFAGLSMVMGMISNLAVPVGLTLTLITLFSASNANDKATLPKRYLQIYLLLYTLVNSLPSLIYLGLIPMHPIALKANLSHMLLDGLVMFVLLQLRARNITEHTKLVVRNLSQAQQDAAAEKRRRNEQSQFLHMLMHELKTPLSIVSLALGTRQRREENLAHAGRAVKDMNAIIERCILADQAGELTMLQNRQKVDLPELIRQLTELTPQLKARLGLKVPSEAILVQTDEQLLKIIVTNLLDNAVHYSDPRTTVEVKLTQADRNGQQGVALHVSNTPGLSGWPDPDQLFSKYYRANGAKRESGSGLGLFLSRQLAHSLNGFLNYEPTFDHVEFVLWIPLKEN